MGEIGAMVARLEEEGIDLNRLIDDELESVGFLSFCSRSTASLSSRADVISGSQNELKTLLKSLEDQLRKIQEEENLPSSILDHDDNDDKGVKHIIVIDDEEETPKNDFSCQASMEEESPPVTVATSSASEKVVSKSVSCSSEPPKPTSVSSSVTMQTRPGNDRVGVSRPHVSGFAKPKMTEARPKCLVTEEGIIGYRTLKSPTESGAATVTSMVTLKSSQPTIPPQHLRSVATPSMPSASARTAIPDTRNDSREQTNNTPAEIPTPQGKRPPSPPKFEEGTRIIGKRADDLWYPGEIIKVIKDRYNQVKFRVKFDQGNRGLLRSNHIALESSPPQDVLHVGSRVVALRPRETADEAASWREATEGPYGKLDVLYAGIVAEICCQQNSNRFLIFFDDGFAQYLPLHKLHHVYHTGDKVWNEVAEHSQEFIQEYLEEFPNRPMVVLKASQWVKTEWRGKWLKAKVMQVDSSLVKMLFQVDNRSEWIYRGSTRLEPLYKALVDGKISKSRKNKRQKKMAQSTDEPYVDMSLTSPQFGFSLYSKTDPKGKKQEESEKNRNEPARQVQQQQQPEGSARMSPGGQDTSSISSSGEQNTLSKEPDTTAKSTGTTNNNNNNNNMPSTTERTNKHTTIGTNTPINTTPNTSTHKSIGINTKRTAAPRNVLPNTQERTGSLTRVNNSCSVPDSTGMVGWSPSPLNHLDDSTASIIQASTMRKRTTAGLVTKTNYSHVGTNMVSIGADSTAVMTSKMVNNGAVSVMSPVMNKLKWEAPWKQQQKTHADSNILKKHMISNSKHDAAALIQERLQAEKKLLGVLKPMPEIKPLIPKPAILGPHKCGKHCGQTKQLDIKEQSKHNMLSVPLMLNWKREITKRHPRSKNEIYYRAPCNKRLRSIADVGKYLTLTGTTNVTIDQFCFDSDISCTNTAINTKNMLLPDISHGTETVSISVVNEHDGSYPPPIDYVSDRILSEGVNIVTDPGFLACCDCTDNCQDKSKCSCAQLTISASAAVDGKEDIAVGYEYRKLMDCVPTGIYECNQNCACSSQCFNRVVQNGIHLRLQVFKTVDRGWGLRTLDDIPVGSFICTYSGQVMNEDMANKEGRDFGDEYLAELDHIEVVEKIKEGYESSVSDIEDDSVILKTLDTGSSECSDTGFMSDNNMSSDTDSVISDSSSLYEPVYQDTVTLKMKNRKKEAKKQSSQNTSPSKDNAVIIKEDGKTFRVSMADEKYVVASSSDTGSIVLRRISLPTEETAEQDKEQGAVPLHSDLCSDPPVMPCEPTVIDLTSSDEDEPLDFPRNAKKKMYNDDDDDGGVKMSKPASSSEDPFDLCLDISTESTLSGDMDQGHVTDTTISSQDHEQLLPNTASNELCPDNSAITDTKSTKGDNTVKMDNEISGVVKEDMTSSMDIENDKEIVMNCEPSLDNTNEDENTIRETVHSDDKSSEIKMHNDSKISSDDDQGNHANHRLCDIQSEHSSHIESTNSCGEEVGKRSDAEVKEAPSSVGEQEPKMNVNDAEGDAVDRAVQSSSASVVTHAPLSSSASSTDSNDHQSSDISHDVQSSSISSNISHAQSSLTSSTDINDHRSSLDISRDVQSSASSDVNHAHQSSSASSDVNHAHQSSTSPDVNHGNQSSSASSDVNHGNQSSSASSDVNHAHQSLSDVSHAHQSSTSPDVNHGNQSSSASSDVSHAHQSSTSPDVNHGNQSSSASSDVNHAHQSSSVSSDVNHAHQSSASSDVNHANQSSASSDVNHANQSSSASDVNHANQSSSESDVNHANQSSASDVNHVNQSLSVDNQDHHSSPDVIHDAQQSSSSSSDISHGQTSSANNQDHESSPDVNHEPQSSSASSDESVPPLMSADDLSKLAAQLHQPHEEPPKLTKMECGVRLTDLKDTITKLKSRGVALDGVSPETVQESTPFLEDLPLFPETSSCEVDSFPPSPVSTESDSSVTDSDEKSSDTSFDHSVRVKSNSTGRRARRFIVTLQKNGVKRSASPRMTGDSPVKKPTTRSLFGEEHCYVIDAKAYGNCGRYLNHSCSPNLFVQNVFIDTHDLRFPRVAFFAQHNISAGSELTWDYMYEVGSVQDKELRCYCGSSQCRGRLL